MSTATAAMINSMPTTRRSDAVRPEKPHKCRQCNKWFVANPVMRNVSCCVDHGGGCCHYSDLEVPTPQSTRPEHLQAHCDACGHNWKIAQHERFLCPYCYNEPTQVAFKGSYVVLADEASQRWFT